MASALVSLSYERKNGQVSWCGVCLAESDDFTQFMRTDVANRLNDAEGKEAFKAHLESLVSTGFGQQSLEQILNAEEPEVRDWAVGEAMAEALLARENDVIWPWNMERDKRTPKASLPGADLVGFDNSAGRARLALGEVKTSADVNTPPNVMNGRSGMAHQINGKGVSTLFHF